MASMGSYNNNESRQSSVDIEFASDPASGGFFNSEFKRHEDLKQMLDSNKDNLKLEAMKRIIGMVAKGKDASDLFPAVVKNVVSSNLEVKKLVYVYLVRYAEEQQDLALLSISTFQRGLKDPNPLIRACALRVLSSIRVHVIVQIMLLAIKETVTDLSPYVRKTTAHAIPKLYSLDPEQKEELVTVIEKLLSDMSTLVVGSAAMAFEEVCPERIDLIHANYRKLCCLLVDVEEWGQVVIINMLTRYARTQFLDPNAGLSIYDEDAEKDRPFYDDEDEDDKGEGQKEALHPPPSLDPDHRLLLANTKPLLLSRNAAVVLSVAQLYEHVAPRGESGEAARALVRLLLRGHREVQAVVLTNIASLSTRRKGMFEPFLKRFFVRSSDPTQIKILKLEVMTNIASCANVGLLLREFQTYIWSSDKQFVAATVQAIGRCASNIKEVTDSCLNGLVKLLSNKDELVVAESVVVVRKLLQSDAVEHKDIVRHMARLVDNIKMGTARASILWLLGEYCDKVPTTAPDVLRRMAQSFVNEEDIVKLQILTLATKLYLTNPAQTGKLCQYVLTLAKYDVNYDIRDRARFIRSIIMPQTINNGEANATGVTGLFARHAKKIFLSAKPPPQHQSSFKEREQFQLGTLSHLINARASGYRPLPPFPEPGEKPDPTVRRRDVSPAVEAKEKVIRTSRTQRSESSPFYTSESEEDSDSDSGSDESSSNEELSSDNIMSHEDKPPMQPNGDKAGPKNETSSVSASSDSDSSEISSGSGSESSSEYDSDDEASPKANGAVPLASNLDLLLGMAETAADETSGLSAVLTPASMPEVLVPTSTSDALASTVASPDPAMRAAAPAYVPKEAVSLLDRVSGGGLSVLRRFTRSPHLYAPSMTSVELKLRNERSPAAESTDGDDDSMCDISVVAGRLAAGVSVHEGQPVLRLAAGAEACVTLGVDFQDSITPAMLNVVVGKEGLKRFPVELRPTVGELVRPIAMSAAQFDQQRAKLRGMNEICGRASLPQGVCDASSLSEKLYVAANVIGVDGGTSAEEEMLKFGSETTSSKCMVLIALRPQWQSSTVEIAIHCEKVMVASMLCKYVEKALAK